MPKDEQDRKPFLIRLPKDLWVFLKHQSALQETSMAEIAIRCLEKYKKKFDSKLTKDDI